MAGLLSDYESGAFLKGLLGSAQRGKPFTALLGGLANMQIATDAQAEREKERALMERKLAMEEEFKRAQIAEFLAQAKQREAEPQKRAEMMQSLRDFIGGGAPSQYGLAGGGVSLGGVREQMTPQSGLAGRTPEDALAFQAATGINPLDFMKAAQVGFEQKPGTFYVKPGGGREFTPDVKEGLGFGSGGVFNLPGAIEAQASRTGAIRGAEEEARARYTLVPGVDPVTKAPVSRFLSDVRAELSATPQSAPQQSSSQSRTGAGGQSAETLNERIRIVSDELAREKDPATASALAREIARLKVQVPGGSSGGGMPTGLSPAEDAAAAANKRYQEEGAKHTAARMEQWQSAAMSAPLKIEKLRSIGSLLEAHDGGKLSPMGMELASAANSLGLKWDKQLPNKEAAQALGREIALQLRDPSAGAGMPGAMSDQDRKYLESMTPNLAQSAAGRKKLVDAQIAMLNRQQQVAQAARNYEKKYGRIDGGFYDQLTAWSRANPLFGDW